MDLEAEPERRVRTPGASESAESSDVANVSVTKGLGKEEEAAAAEAEEGEGGRGRWGCSLAAAAGGKVSSSPAMAGWPDAT